MGYVAPDSTIRILSGVPLDSTYEHTLYFSSKSAQETYFISKTIATFNSYSYVKPEEGGVGSVKVNIGADRLYSANYLMFRNTAFGSKWFYAFITDVEYINNVTTKVSFIVDELQTWLRDFTPEYCLVEREHTETDGYGEHLELEPVIMGDYIYSNFEPFPYISSTLSNSKILVMATFDKNYVDSTEENINIEDGEVYSGLCLNFFDSASEVKDFIVGAYSRNKGDGIVQIKMVGNQFCDGNLLPNPKTTFVGTLPKKYDNIDGHPVRNKKLFNFPYNYLLLTNNSNYEVVLKYEYFSGSNVSYNAIVTLNDQPCLTVYPTNYDGVEGINIANKIELTMFPLCSYNNDFWKAWLATNAAPTAAQMWMDFHDIIRGGFNLAGSIMQVVGGDKNKGVSGIVSASKEIDSSLVSTVNSANTIMNASRRANTNIGGSGSNVEYTLGRLQIEYSRVTIRREFAEKIDSFFDKYGYICNKVKKPVYTNRPYWNYIKTKGCDVKGDLPVTARNKIAEIFNSGITFWKNPEFVGNYSLDNSPT